MPDAVTLLVLILAAFRLTRLAGWDDFPLAAKLRAKAIGERWVPLAGGDAVYSRSEYAELLDAQDAPSLPGKQPPSEADGVRPAYDRPTLAHLVHCPFCIGFWISVAVAVGWLLWHPLEYGLLPFAVSGAVGLTAKNLDP